jgi:hypothetical protein
MQKLSVVFNPIYVQNELSVGTVRMCIRYAMCGIIAYPEILVILEEPRALCVVLLCCTMKRSSSSTCIFHDGPSQF